MAKIENDKYYTPKDLAKYCIDKTFEIIGEENITDIIEPSAGNGSFSNQLNCIAYDILPENDRIIKQDFLTLDLDYKKGRLIIGNPPYGRYLNLAQKFYKKSIQLGDYISFILPISQLNNTKTLYEFDLIYSEDLGKRKYSEHELHCCLNIFKRNPNGLNKRRKILKLKDVTIVRKDACKNYSDVEYDLRICRWGCGSMGKILNEDEHFAGEYKIKIHNKKLKDEIKKVLMEVDWKERIKAIASPAIHQYHIIELLKEKIPEIK